MLRKIFRKNYDRKIKKLQEDSIKNAESQSNTAHTNNATNTNENTIEICEITNHTEHTSNVINTSNITDTENAVKIIEVNNNTQSNHIADTNHMIDTSNNTNTNNIADTNHITDTSKISKKIPKKVHALVANTKHNILHKTNAILEMFENLLFKEPLVYSLAYENNIACKLNDNILATRDGNICAGLKLEGVSYAGATQARELDLSGSRLQFFNRLDSTITLNIFCKKELIDLNMNECPIKNKYAEKIIKKWENGTKAYKINYYLIFSTKTKRVTGFFESKKRAMTEEKEETENKKNLYNDKIAKMKQIIQESKACLEEYTPKILSSDDLLNLFATYSNMQDTKLKYSYDLITDSYMTSDVEFKKDYMVFSTNTNATIYARFISVKAYETESISSLIPTHVLRENADYYFLFNCEALKKEEAISKVKRVRTFSVDIAQNNLDILIQLLQSERENIIKISLSILVISKESLQDLNEKSNRMKALLERQNLSVVKETLNQKPLYFSFFPSRSNLNARKRHQTSAVLSTLCTFENDILGNKENRWGKQPITIFQHLSGSPFFFNFHDNATSSSVGHTLVIGGTGYGKTTIMQFLILNLFKYDINIFALDKLRGMCAFTEFVGGEYHDLEKGEFKLNPFSLQDTEENNMFLRMWLNEMAEISKFNGESQQTLKDIISDTLKSLRYTQERKIKEGVEQVMSLNDFYNSMHLPNNNSDLRIQFKEYLNGLFDNKECALNFNKQLSILNMDAILKNPKISALSAMYLFHKIKNISKNANKGFFIWIDELRDYLNDSNMKDKIIEMIVEIRKINGVITMGLQNLDFLNDISNSNTFIDNMSNFIIFPTKDEKTLEQLQTKLSLSGNEINFLQQASKESRQVLYKQKEVGSAILNINLGRLGEYLRIFSSSSEDVLEMYELKKQHPHEWRDMYLKGLKPILE